MIRVFPRRTKWTPTDELAFIGDPHLFRPPEMPVRISCTFTWDIEEAYRLERSWGRFYDDVQVGGPALDDPGGDFESGVFLREGITITSRGCTKDCQWCFVPKREGWIRELPIMDGWNVVDNNLLSCSRSHVEAVFGMLHRQSKAVTFSGGLDTELLQEWHILCLKSIRINQMFFACDYPGAFKHLERAAGLLSDFPERKKRCYVLIGFNGETVAKAEARLGDIYALGFLPFAMLYKGMESQHWSDEWRHLQKKWARPAAYRRQVTASQEG